MKRIKRTFLSNPVRHARVLCRWMRVKWRDRVRALERQLGGKIDCC